MIYFDCNATSPPHPRLGEVLQQALSCYWANPESCHGEGRRAANALEQTRLRCARFLGCDFQQVIFTSGGTEANNLAIRGALAKTGPCHVITSAFEHSSVEKTIQSLKGAGYDATFIPPGPGGMISPEEFANTLRPGTRFASIMTANNEIGTIQPIGEISRICRQAGIILHTDGVQAAGKMPLSFRELGCDLFSFSGHKLGAPRGTGGLVVRDASLLMPQATGGHQENDLRAGSSDVPSLFALGFVCRWLHENLEKNLAEIREMRDEIEDTLKKLDAGRKILGLPGQRIANTTFFVPSRVDGRLLVEELDRRGICVSSSAACDGGQSRAATLMTGGRPGVRISISHFTTAEEARLLCKALGEIFRHLD
jgi:cysteine desulfurase